MEKTELWEVTDLSNILLYRLKNSNNCELCQEVVDRFRDIVQELLIEERMCRDNFNTYEEMKWKN